MHELECCHPLNRSASSARSPITFPEVLLETLLGGFEVESQLQNLGSTQSQRLFLSETEEGVITKVAFSLEESLVSLKSLNSLQSLENGRIFLCFPQTGDSLEVLESLNSLESLDNGFF